MSLLGQPDPQENAVRVKDLGTALTPIIKAQKDITDAIGNVNDLVQKSVTDIDRIEKAFDGQIKALEALVASRLEKKPEVDPQDVLGLDGPMKMQMKKVFYKSKDGHYQDIVSGADLLFTWNLLHSAKHVYNRKGGSSLSISEVPSASERLRQFYEQYKAYTETGAGTGDELVPLFMSPELWRDVFVSSRVASQFERFNMPSNPFDVPLDFSEATFSKIAELGLPSADDAATRNVRMTATKQLNLKEWSYELNEAAIVALSPALRANVLRGAQRYIDNFVICADSETGGTGNVNSDDSAPASSSYYLSDGQNGLRRQFLRDNTAMGVPAGGALTTTHLAQALAKMDDYGVDVENLRIFPGLRAYLLGLRLLPENITMDKFGPNATIRTGQVSLAFGSPVVPTSSVPLTEADGKVSATPANNTKGQIVIAHRDMTMVGYIRNIMVEMDIDIKLQKWIMVTSYRLALAKFGSVASAKHTSGVYNITV